jgi:hypothetical protein
MNYEKRIILIIHLAAKIVWGVFRLVKYELSILKFQPL